MRPGASELRKFLPQRLKPKFPSGFRELILVKKETSKLLCKRGLPPAVQAQCCLKVTLWPLPPAPPSPRPAPPARSSVRHLPHLLALRPSLPLKESTSSHLGRYRLTIRTHLTLLSSENPWYSLTCHTVSLFVEVSISMML